MATRLTPQESGSREPPDKEVTPAKKPAASGPAAGDSVGWSEYWGEAA